MYVPRVIIRTAWDFEWATQLMHHNSADTYSSVYGVFCPVSGPAKYTAEGVMPFIRVLRVAKSLASCAGLIGKPATLGKFIGSA